jgi:hypothetical protein
LEYGFDLYKLFPKLRTSTFYLKSDKSTRNVLMCFSHNPLDFQLWVRDRLIFFWKPHIQRVINLDTQRCDFLAKKNATLRIVASMRAHFVRMIIMHKANSQNNLGKLFYLSAPHGTGKTDMKRLGYTVDAPSPEDIAFIGKNIGKHHSVRPWGPPCTKARAMLQRFFLAYRGRMTLPCSRNPSGVLDKLQMLEALRPHSFIVTQIPAMRLMDMFDRNVHRAVDVPLL